MYRNSRLAVLVGLILGCCLPGAHAQGLSAQQLVATTFETYDGKRFQELERAVALFRGGQLDACRESLGKVKQAEAEMPPADTMLTLMLLSVNQPDRARKSLEEAAINDPQDPEAYLVMADLALREGNLIAAKLGYQQSLELTKLLKTTERRAKSLKARATAGLASLSEARKLYGEAAEYLTQWHAIDSGNPVPIGSLGRVYFLAGKYTEAEEQFLTLEKMDKDSPPMEIAMGRLFASNAMQDKARTYMTAAIAKHPDDIRSRLTVAEWAIGLGDLELAEEQIRRSLQIDANSVTAKVLQGRVYRQRGDFMNAAAMLETTILEAPDRFTAANELARTLASSNDEKKRRLGLDYARRNFQLYAQQANQYSAEAIFTYAFLLHRNGRSEDAEMALLALPNGTTISNENAYYAAQVYDARGKTAMALNALQAALAGDKTFPGYAEAEAMLERLEKDQGKNSSGNSNTPSGSAVSNPNAKREQPVVAK